MTRHLFPGDTIWRLEGGPAIDAPFTWWSHPVAGVQYTDFLAADGSTPLTELKADAIGLRHEMYGPDDVEVMFCDTGVGVRFQVAASDSLAAKLDEPNLGPDLAALQEQVDAVGEDATAALSGVQDLANTPAILPGGGSTGDILYRLGEREGQWAPPPAGGSGGPVDWDDVAEKPLTFPPSSHSHPAGQISDASTVGRQVLTAADAQKAREAIGAGTGSGTSNLVLGSKATEAAPGNHAHTAVAVAFVPNGQITATNVQDALAQVSAAGGSGGSSTRLDWVYKSGAYPALPATKPPGLERVDAIGPTPPISPSWCGYGPTQAKLSYSKVPLT